MAEQLFDITIINNSIGTAPSSDGVMMLFCKAIAVSTTFVLDTKYLLTKFDDLAALGIDADYDITNKLAVYKQVKEFYDESGDGALLWLVGVAKATAYKDYVSNSTGTTFKQLVRETAFADASQRAKMIGFAYDVPQTANTSTDFPSDVTDTMTALKTTQASMFAEGYQWSAIVDGYNMKSTATPSTLATRANDGNYTVSLCITGTSADGVSAIGNALGKYSRISIGTEIGKVADGSLAITSAYLTNGVKPTYSNSVTLLVGSIYTVVKGTVTYDSNTYAVGESFTCLLGKTSFTGTGLVSTQLVTATNVSEMTGNFSGSDFNLLGTKQFMFIRKQFEHTGFYWNDGATCDLSTKSLSNQSFNRVANHLAANVLSFMINDKGKTDIPINAQTGKVDAGYCGVKQQEFYDTYINPLKIEGGTGDLNDGALTMTGTPQGTTIQWAFSLKVIPAFASMGASGTIEFVTTL